MDSYTSNPVSIQSGIDVGGNKNVAGNIVLDITLPIKPHRKPNKLSEIIVHLNKITKILSKIKK